MLEPWAQHKEEKTLPPRTRHNNILYWKKHIKTQNIGAPRYNREPQNDRRNPETRKTGRLATNHGRHYTRMKNRISAVNTGRSTRRTSRHGHNRRRTGAGRANGPLKSPPSINHVCWLGIL